tara:strand:- start:16460 stop:16843 length:384 start_codon:yes stop_codon:yes gene_type:complete
MKFIAYFLLSTQSICTLAAIPTVEIEEQEVKALNGVNIEVLDEIISDLNAWCTEIYNTNCGAHTVSSLISIDETIIFYVVEVSGLDDAAVAYMLNAETSEITGKQKLNYWARPFKLAERKWWQFWQK